MKDERDRLTGGMTKPRCVAAGACLAALLTSTTAAAQLVTTVSGPATMPANRDAQVIEWDLPATADAQPGAMMVDLYAAEGAVWFTTRTGEPPRVYRLDMKRGKKHEYASWSSWDLAVDSLIAAGVRKVKATHDRRYVFVRTLTSLQRIDTESCVYSTAGIKCPRLVWVDLNTSGISDVAVDADHKVFSAVAMSGDQGEENYIHRLDPKAAAGNLTRWKVGGGAGSCSFLSGAPGNLSDTDPCLSGIDVHPKYKNLVYYAEPTGGPDNFGAIAELNTYTNVVRRWLFSSLNAKLNDTVNPVKQPRHLHIDSDGKVWVNTGSGHLVSLDPNKNRMTRHLMPGGATANTPWGIAPDHGVIGYTAIGPSVSDLGEKHTVAMLLPDRDFVAVSPLSQSVPPIKEDVAPRIENAFRVQGQVKPQHKTVPRRVTPTQDGTFVEGLIHLHASPSRLPLGVSPDQGSAVGTFFYAVGMTDEPAVNRIGRIRLPREANQKGHKERDDDDGDDDGRRHHEDDDDDDDGVPDVYDNDSDNDGHSDVSDGDDDDDGVEDEWDSPGHKENKDRFEDDTDTGGFASSEKSVTTSSSTLLLAAVVESSDLLAPLSVEIVNAAGVVVARSPQMAGKAVVTYIPLTPGTYTIRSRNHGPTPTRFTTSVIARELWPEIF